MSWSQNIHMMDEKADEIIAGWTFGALAANLLPPPLDTIAVGAVFARLGAAIGEVYGVTLNWDTLIDMSKAIASGVGSVATASYIGTGLLKYVPGLNVWVALLVQPPMVAAVAYAAGNSFKDYYRLQITEGCDLTIEQLQEMAKSHFRHKIG
ncbi:hypothetical protein CAL7716_106390 (plasmid) [Calothrix sp. PCC 7716]|nr:hypothetical protein CAL7716_106390 [Calothrix sp. PCC 7716]